jgi:hypothetical protein
MSCIRTTWGLIYGGMEPGIGCDGDVGITSWLMDAAVSCKWVLSKAADSRGNSSDDWDITKSVIVLAGVPHCYEFRARNASACTQSWLYVHDYQVAQYCPSMCPPEFSVDIPLQCAYVRQTRWRAYRRCRWRCWCRRVIFSVLTCMHCATHDSHCGLPGCCI